MYCPTCGARLAKALSYCNRCGANLSALTGDANAGNAETTTDTLVWVIVGTTITLLGMALGALVLIKHGNIPEGLGTVFVILSFVALGLVEGVLLWRLLRFNRAARETWVPAQSENLSTNELKPASERALNEPAHSVPTVTEQTTRNLEPSQRKGEQG